MLTDIGMPLTPLEAALYIKDHLYTYGRLQTPKFYARHARWPCHKRMVRLMQKMHDAGCLPMYTPKKRLPPERRLPPPYLPKAIEVQTIVFGDTVVPIHRLEYSNGLRMGSNSERYHWAQRLRTQYPDTEKIDDLTLVTAALFAGLKP